MNFAEPPISLAGCPVPLMEREYQVIADPASNAGREVRNPGGNLSDNAENATYVFT